MKYINCNMIVSALFAATFVMSGCTVFGRQATQPAQPERDIPVSTPVSKDNSNLSADISGEWVITAVGTATINRDEDMPYLTFEPSTRKFYGNNGCNTLNGTYKINGNKLTFGNVLSTMRYCADCNFDTNINEVIRDGNTVHATVKKVGTESYLYLNDKSGRSLLTLVRHSMQFLNGQWQVVSINSKEVNDDEANVFFDISSMKIHGNTGCNYFNGSIMIDPAISGSISFSGMGVTRMACNKGDQERLMLVALEETASAVADGPDYAILVDGSGKPVMRLHRVKITDSNN